MSTEEPPDSPDLADAAVKWSAAYVHLPFCARICPYCDFAVVAGRDDLIDRYVAAVEREIDSEEPWRPLDSIYFGGGTPSRMPASSFRRLLGHLAQQPGLGADPEISLEANPEDWSPFLADGLVEAGLNRVSFGAQSFTPATLNALGRRHEPGQIVESVKLARRAGFRSINLDLIFGTPGESLRLWQETVERALETEPDHISCYALTVEPGTQLGREVAAGGSAPDPDLQADAYEYAQERLGRAGLVRYEVSNWARPGHHVRYNLAVWAQAEYLAFGLGAHRFRGRVRSRNYRRMDSYLDAIEAGLSAVAGSETVEGWDREVERVFLGIRRTAGVVAGAGGEALSSDQAGERLRQAGIIAHLGGRLVVLRPLLTDAVARAVLALPTP
jgi:oxygen-independent coproporphyrinogen-3 oxidase